MARFLLELAPCLLAGLIAGRLWPDLATALATPLIRWGVPVAVVGLILRTPFDPSLITSALMGLVLSGGGLAVVLVPGPWRRWLPAGPLALGMVVGNTAYWGLPVATALLPAAALPHAITLDLIGTLLTWSLGPLVLTPAAAAPSAGRWWRLLLGSPAAQALLIALPLQASPWAAPLARALWLPARLLMLLALALVGMRLARLPAMAPAQAPAGPGLPLALLGKLVLLPALALVLGVIVDLGAPLRGALVLQAAAPTAVSVLLLAEAHRARADQAAGLLLWSTGLALITVPLWALLLRWIGDTAAHPLLSVARP